MPRRIWKKLKVGVVYLFVMPPFWYNIFILRRSVLCYVSCCFDLLGPG